MTVKLLTEHHLEFLSFKGGCTGSSESILDKMMHCWKSYDTTQFKIWPKLLQNIPHPGSHAVLIGKFSLYHFNFIIVYCVCVRNCYRNNRNKNCKVFTISHIAYTIHLELQNGITLAILIRKPLSSLPNMHCLTVKVWCKFNQNQTKATHKLFNKNLEMLTGGRNDGTTDRLKQYTSLNYVCGGGGGLKNQTSNFVVA